MSNMCEAVNKEWFDKDCREAIKCKNKERAKMLEKETRGKCTVYKERRREASKICRQKKRDAIKA